MKKLLAVFTALSLLAFAGSAFATTVTATPTTVFAIVGINSPTASITGTAAHNGTLTYEKTSGPAWAEFSNNTITFTPGSGVVDGPYTVTITVTEAYTESYDVEEGDPSSAGHVTHRTETRSLTETASATVTATVYNIKPITLTASTTNVAVTAGTTTGTATLTGAAANGGSVAYTMVSGPAWASLSGNTLTFTPGRDVNADTYPVTVRATETYTLADGVQRTATSQNLVINVQVAAAPVVVEPITSKDEKDTGNESTKTSEAAVVVKTETVTKVVTTTTTETKTVTVQTFADTAVAATKIVTTVAKEVTTQTVTQATETLRVATTAAATTAANNIVSTLVQTTTTTTTTTATEVATQLLVAVKATDTSTTPTEENTSTAAADASKQSMVTSLLKGKTEASDTSDAVNTSFLNSKAQTKADGTQETLAETLLRVLDETIATAARVLTADNPTTVNKLQSMFTSTTTSTTTTTTVSVVNSTVLQNASVTQEDGSENDDAPEFEDVMAQLAQQAQQEVENAEEGTVAGDKADTKLAEVQQEAPVAVAAPVALPDDAEPSIAMLNLPPQKPDMYGKKIKFRALKQRKGNKFSTAVFTTAAIDTNEDGTGIFLNSIGQSVDTVPGENEWGTPEGETEEQLIIPGQITVAMLMNPGTVYTPIVTTPSEELKDIEGVSTTTESMDVSVDVTTVEVVEVEVPVYDTVKYSTSFDAELVEYFTAPKQGYEQGYDVHVGEFIVAGEAGVYSVNSAADTAMLAATNRAVVQTLPMIAPKGEHASDTAGYVMKVRYEIPRDTDTLTISSADTVLAFWPNALVTNEGTYATRGEADFLDETGRAMLTANMVRQIAKGKLGTPIDETTQGYTGYVVMTLAKLDDDAEPYKPVITVKREAVVAAEPGGDTPSGPGGDTPSGPGGDTPGGDEPTTGSLGSAGGGCDAGFGALAFAVLAGFIAARKK